MLRDDKAERSRRRVLDAALSLFAHQGFRATSVRDIADRAKVSTGNVYHHFADKEAIFRELLEEYQRVTVTKRFPFTRALTNGIFPDNLEQLGAGVRDSVREYREYVALILVDVIEFEGEHVRRFYGELGQRLIRMLDEEGKLDDMRKRLRPGVSPSSAVQLATRILFNYFMIEILFNVPEPFGKPSQEVVLEIADMLRNGIV